jgi:two-component system sensor histidine kinase NreB
LTMTEERERKEIAGVLHDDLIQKLIMCKMGLDELKNSERLAHRRNSLYEIGEKVRAMIEGIRSLTFDLYSPILYDIGLEAAIRDWLDREVRDKYNTTFEFKDDGKKRQLGGDIGVVVYRAVRELCTNIIKHSNAERAIVSIHSINNNAEIIVEDDGIGMTTEGNMGDSIDNRSLGLFGIRERLDHFGGRMNIESEVNVGTKITITVPLNTWEDVVEEKH